MASWSVRSSPDRSNPGSSPGACFSKVPAGFSQPETLELFYLHVLSITSPLIFSCFHTTFFRSIHRPVFRYRFIKNGLIGPVKS